MNFSELFKQSGHLCRFSPDGKYLVSYFICLRTKTVPFQDSLFPSIA